MIRSPEVTDQAELDAELVKVRFPAPTIWVGPDFPIDHWIGWGNPYPDYYKGARVMRTPALGDRAYIEQAAQM